MDTDLNLCKTNFLARMSHEMRTPLNAIIGMCTIAQSSDDPRRVSSCLEKINEASLHLLGMINDVLDMAKIETGKLKLSNTELNVGQMLQKTVGTRRFTLEAKKQNLILDFDPDLPETIVSDEQRLTQVLDNLLSNAVKFTPPEGTITLSVKKLKESGSTCTLGIMVSDTGIGITDEELKTIFALFEQAEGGMARKYEGTGIGLAISSSIVRLMGGEIRISSERGKGSTFSFEITVEKAGKDELEYYCPDNAYDVKTPGFSGFSILLAEDVEINREIVLSLLEDSGLDIDCAENGLEALEKFRASPSKYSLILMDIHMPEMDGFEATRQIRAFEKEFEENFLEFAKTEGLSQTPQLLGRPKRVPIIAMTANVFKDDVKKCLACGMTGHLGKPIEHEALMEQLSSCLSQKIPLPVS